MAELLDQIAEVQARVAKYAAALDAAHTEKDLDRFTSLINSNIELLNRLLDEKKAVVVKTLTLMVKIYIGDQAQDSLITFNSSTRPLDIVIKEASALPFLKRHINFDSYKLVTTKNLIVSDFASIEGQTLLIFHIPEKITPLSGNEWTNVQLDQLKIIFEEVDCANFFVDAQLTQFSMSKRGEDLVRQLSDIDQNLFQKYIPDATNLVSSCEAIRADTLLQHPICKALFAARKYVKHESFIDDFVKHLLNEMGFNEGSLYAAPQMRINLFFGSTEKMATADFTIIDLLSFARIGVLEDKNWSDMMLNSDSTPQLVAEGIAITQRNEAIVGGHKRNLGGDPIAGADLEGLPARSETVYGIRVTGTLFHFYALRISSEIHLALQNQTAAASQTTMYRYKTESGLDFMVKQERDDIILMLSLLQEVAKKN